MPFHAGSFLVAKPSLQDPNFRHTVVLIVQHTADGAFGFVCNRPIPIKEFPFSVFRGGPCEAQGLFMLHGVRDWARKESGELVNQVAPGIFIGDAESADRAKDLLPEQIPLVRMFAGYSGWGPGQLESELAEGAWVLVHADGKTLFETEPKDLWAHLRPPSIPEPSIN